MEINEEKRILDGILLGVGLDHEYPILEEIVRNVFKVKLRDFYTWVDICLTKELLEKEENLLLIENLKMENEYLESLKYMILGALILKKKARINESLAKRILASINWDLELKMRWVSDYGNLERKKYMDMRENLLIDFKALFNTYYLSL